MAFCPWAPWEDGVKGEAAAYDILQARYDTGAAGLYWALLHWAVLDWAVLDWAVLEEHWQLVELGA